MNANKFIEDCAKARAKNKTKERKFLKSQWKFYFGKKVPSKLTDIEMRAKIYSFLTGKGEKELFDNTASRVIFNNQKRSEKEPTTNVKVKESYKDICVFSNGNVQVSKIKLVDGMCFPDGNYPVLKSTYKSSEVVYCFTESGKCYDIQNSFRSDEKVVSLINKRQIYVDVGNDGYMRKTEEINVGEYYPKNLLSVLPFTTKVLLVFGKEIKIINVEDMKTTQSRKRIIDGKVTHCTEYDDDCFLLVLYNNGKLTITDKVPRIKEGLLFIKAITCQENLVMITDGDILKTKDLSELPLGRSLKVKLNKDDYLKHAFLGT